MTRNSYFPLSAATDAFFQQTIADLTAAKAAGFHVDDVQRIFVKPQGEVFVEANQNDPGAVPAGKIVLKS